MTWETESCFTAFKAITQQRHKGCFDIIAFWDSTWISCKRRSRRMVRSQYNHVSQRQMTSSAVLQPINPWENDRLAWRGLPEMIQLFAQTRQLTCTQPRTREGEERWSWSWVADRKSAFEQKWWQMFHSNCSQNTMSRSRPSECRLTGCSTRQKGLCLCCNALASYSFNTMKGLYDHCSACIWIIYSTSINLHYEYRYDL